ncbi:hypothetical protein RDI58_028900 [Solanum bulbocastanum]|uniref:Uncharacterized protein n=1 Tax=Solanum bulbocastanum TaxID=147425 RepID=A0AAN8STG7_SOLBU
MTCLILLFATFTTGERKSEARLLFSLSLSSAPSHSSVLTIFYRRFKTLEFEYSKDPSSIGVSFNICEFEAVILSFQEKSDTRRLCLNARLRICCDVRLFII